MGYVGYGTPDSIDRGGSIGRSQADPGPEQYAPIAGGSPGTWSQGGFYPDASQMQGWQNMYQAGVIDPNNAAIASQIGDNFDPNNPNSVGGILGQSITLQDMMSGTKAGEAQQEAGWGLQGIDLSRQSLGIQQNALARQMALLPQQYDIQKQGFDITQRGEQQSADLRAYALNNQAAAQGAYTAAGTNVGRTGIQQNLQNQFGQLNLQRQDADLTFQERQAQQQDAEKQLGVAAKRLDLSTDELRGRLTNTLAQLGISNQISVNQIMSEAAKVNQGRYSPIAGLINLLFTAQNTPILVPNQGPGIKTP